MTSFHEVLFPLDIALKSAGGPQRRTDVVTLGSGAEERNARWAHSRRRYDAGYGVKTFNALSQVVAFFEERRGRLYGFRWRDRLDHSSAAPGVSIRPTDQIIGIGDGVTATFQLGKTYGARFGTRFSPSARPIHFRATSHTGRPLCSLHISAAVRLRKLHVFSRASDAAWL